MEGTKTWNDNNDAEEDRPESIKVNLLADGVKKDSKTVTAADGWKYSFTNLPKYAGGKEIIYTVEEEVVRDYTSTVEGYDIINEYTPGYTGLTVTKVWDDADNQDGVRPDSIEVQLYAGLFKRGDVVVLSEDNNWTYTWSNLPAKKYGFDVTYTVKEVTDLGDAYISTQDGTTNVIITNTHTPETVGIEGEKYWEDNDDQDGIRPTEITVNLLADGEVVDTKTVTAADEWKYSFTDLPKNKRVDGQTVEIVYTVQEDAVDGYETIQKDEGYDITNFHEPETIDIEGEKIWADNENQDGVRPDAIKVNLLAGDTVVKSIEVTEADNWSYKFTDLPKFDNGVEIIYTVLEDAVENYSTSYDGYSVINSYTPQKTSRTVVKVWDDLGNRDGRRPTSISVQLYADGEAYGSPVILSELTGWRYTWEDLDVKKAGKDIEYKVSEISVVDGYTTSYSEDTFVITNTRRVEPTPTPIPTPTPTPGNDSTPDPTPEITPGTTPGTPVPTPPSQQVLGARRVSGNAVLGARRGSDFAVLGKRRRPQTGDSMALILWILALAAAAGGTAVSAVKVNQTKKRNK